MISDNFINILEKNVIEEAHGLTESLTLWPLLLGIKCTASQ
jgi:hypothetical protein